MPPRFAVDERISDYLRDAGIFQPHRPKGSFVYDAVKGDEGSAGGQVGRRKRLPHNATASANANANANAGLNWEGAG